MAPLSFVRSIFLFSLLASSSFARPTHGIRPRHKGHTTIVSQSESSTPTEDPSTSPLVTPVSTDGPSYGQGTPKAQAVGDESTSKSKTKTTKAQSSTKKAKATSTSAAPPEETSEDTSDDTPEGDGEGIPSGGSGRMAALTPIGGVKGVVSFSDAFPNGKALSELPVTRQAKTSKFTAGTFNGRKAIKTVMTKGSIAPGSGIAGGMSFYSPATELQTSGKRHYLFSYSVFFEKGFSFNKGGKLPGLFGGSDANVATQCSGGKHPEGCFSMRLMWRENGQGELYAYIPVPTAATRSYNKNDQKCGRNASGKCNGDYGYSIGRGAWSYVPGQWTTVAERIKLNTVGKADGEAEIYINGKSVLKVNGLVYRTSANVKAFGRQMQTFFGGHTAEWASPKDQNIFFADMTTSLLD